MQYREKSAKVEALQFKNTPSGISEMKNFVHPYVFEVIDCMEKFKINGTLISVGQDCNSYLVLGYNIDGSINLQAPIADVYPNCWLIKHKNWNSKKPVTIEQMNEVFFKSKYEIDQVCGI